MNEVAYLEIRVGSQGVNAASESLRQFTTSSSAAEQATLRLVNAERHAADVAQETREKTLKNLRDSYEVKRQLIESSSKSEESKAAALARLDEQQIQRISVVTAASQKAAVAAEVAAARKALADANRAEKEAAADEEKAKRVAAVEAEQARKAAAAKTAAFEKADRAATDAAIREGRAQQRAADDAAKAAARVEAEQARKASAVQAAAVKQEQAIASAGQRELAEVNKWLMTEEEAVRSSYLRRRRIIETQATGSQKQMMLSSLDYKYQQQNMTLKGSTLEGYLPWGEVQQRGGAGVSAKEAESAADGIKRLALQYIGLQTAISGVRKLIEVNREFDKLNAGLITATGSASGASQAFGVLDDFAAKTPYSLRETTGGFVKLVNYGLMPSERALRSYGNTASALGKDLDMMIEAVADAQTGEFERLKEFGVKAKQEGDKVTLTFRGVSTTVNKNSKEIQEYLIKLGETNFGDAMANRMDTLDGKLSNLGDAWDKMFREIGNSDVGGLIKDFCDTGISAIEGLVEIMDGPTMSTAVAGLKSFFIELAGEADKLVGYITLDKERIKNAEATTQALLRQIVIEQQGAENEREFTKAIRENEKAAKDRLAQYERSGDLSGLDTFNQSMANANAKFSESEEKRREQQVKAAAQREQQEFKQLTDKLRTEEEAIEESYAKRQALIDKKTKAGSELNVKLTYSNSQIYENEMANTKAAKLRETQEKEVKDLEDSLRAKEEAARASYERQRDMVLARVDDEARAEKILTALADQESKRRLATADEEKQKTMSRQRQKEDLFTPYRSEEDQILLAEKRRLEEYKKAREDDLLSETEYQYLKAKLHKETESKIAESDLRNKEQIAGNSAALFGNLAQVSKNLGGQQSAAYKGLFAMSKAFSIAQATMSIATGTAKALELGWPAGLAAGLQVAAQGAGLLAQITSSNYSGAYDKGGYIPSGRIGLVGERGPEFVHGPAMVTSRRDTAAIIRDAGQPSQAPQVNLRIFNAPDPSASRMFLTSSNGETTITNLVRRNATTIKTILGVR